MVLLVDFISYSLSDFHDSRPAKVKRNLDWIVKRFDPDHGSEHEHSQENLALAERLVDELPRPRMRQHYRNFFNSEQQTDKILMEVLSLLRILVAMYGYVGYTDNEPRDKWDTEISHDHPTFGQFYGDLNSHQILDEVEWDVQNLSYQMIVCLFRVHIFDKHQSCVYIIWKR